MNENDKLDRVIEKLGEFGAHLAKIDEKLEWYNKSLDVHIKRTELLEKDMQVALLPVKVGKFLAAFATGATAILGFLKAIGKL